MKRSTSDTVHWFLFVFPRFKCMPSMQPLTPVVTEKLTKSQELKILIMCRHMCKHTCIMRTRKPMAQASADADWGYHISTPLLRKGMLKLVNQTIIKNKFRQDLQTCSTLLHLSQLPILMLLSARTSLRYHYHLIPNRFIRTKRTIGETLVIVHTGSHQSLSIRDSQYVS